MICKREKGISLTSILKDNAWLLSKAVIFSHLIVLMEDKERGNVATTTNQSRRKNKWSRAKRNEFLRLEMGFPEGQGKKRSNLPLRISQDQFAFLDSATAHKWNQVGVGKCQISSSLHLHILPVPEWHRHPLFRHWWCLTPAICRSGSRCQVCLLASQRYSTEQRNCKLPH